MSENKVKIKPQDESLSVSNAEIYKKPKKSFQDSREFIQHGSTKKKVSYVREFSNGVIKRELVGLIKDGKKILDRGIDNKK